MSDDLRVTKEVHVTPGDLAGFIVSLGGVRFWIVAAFPLYVGWVLAQNPLDPAGRHLFIDDLRIVLALVVIGPLLGTFALLSNLYVDMEDTDRVNPRKQYVQAMDELIDRGTVAFGAWGFAAIGLLLAFFISQNLITYEGADESAMGLLGTYVFLALMGATVLLSILYSHPATRWKGVPGLDVIVNVLGFGVICPLAGWALLRPVEQFPLWYLAASALFVGSVYVPTTASDYESDRSFHIRTLAVALGVRRAMMVGFLFLLGGFALLTLGDRMVWFPFDGPATHVLGVLWPFLAIQILLYFSSLGRASQARIWALLLLLSIVQGLATLLFLFQFTAGQTLAT